jgi:hypothetical protein
MAMGLYSTARQRKEDETKGNIGLVLVLVFVVLLFAAFQVKAELRLEMGRGQCQQSLGGKGSWWNDHYRTFIDLNDSCYQVGISAAPWTWRGYDLGLRLAYVDLGRVRINSEMAARDDDQLSNPDGSHCDWKAWGKGCLISVKGGGHPRGFTLGPIAERKMFGAVVGAETGLFAYYNHFTVNVSAYPDPSQTPDWWWYKQWDLARGWNFTPYVGFNVRTDKLKIPHLPDMDLMLSVRTYAKVVASSREKNGSSGVTNGEAIQVNLALSVPLTL